MKLSFEDIVIACACSLLFVAMMLALGSALHSCELDVVPHGHDAGVRVDESDSGAEQDGGA